MKILLFGSRGFLGKRFMQVFPGIRDTVADIAEPVAVHDALELDKPDVVINCAGKTGRPNVDWCEGHKEETLRGNVTGPLVLLEQCRKHGIRLVHVSSGCIYQGDNGGAGFTEEDPPNFGGSFYARTKAWADQILKEFPVLVLRLRMPFDGSTDERSLIMKLKKYGRVLDAPNSLTYLPDFLDAAKALVEKGATGVYNVVNPGLISPLEVMEMYRDIVDPGHSFERLALESLGEVTKAGRSNCALSTKKLEGEGIRLLPVREAVEKALRDLKNAS